MKRDNKGFTLIELLGAIVILGILVGISVPIIVSLLDTSRNKIYINDAKKLVAQAEYKLKSNSSDIEKPDDGDCIIVSMVYLDSSDFDNPPNEGQYEKESSYVVVKNNGGKLEYSVSIVENVKKGGYKGVELVKYSELSSNNALSHVVSFTETELVNVESDVNRGYINNKLGDDYILSENRISAIYNYPDLADSSSNNDTIGSPKITFASLISTSNKDYNSLDVTLQLKAEDKDTPRSNLQVFLAVDSGYENATTPIAYGENDTFSYNINFADYGKGYDGSTVKLYIIVKDTEGNATKKTMTYRIHNNVAPEIGNTSTITKRNGDSVNMTAALVKLDINDDIDTTSSFSVCFKESSNNEDFDNCDSYHRYEEYFNSDNAMIYQFNSCTGGCKRDGSTHYLTVFIKDSLGGISKKKFSYTFSTNTAPSIKSLSVNSQQESFTSNASKKIVVTVNAEDDVDRDDQMTVRVSDGTNTSTYNYSQQPIYYEINSLYDGSTKSIKVSLIDSEGGVNERTESYTLYKNKKPKINSYNVTSSSTVCNNQELCPPSEGGSKTVNITLDAEDDIDYQNDYSDLSVCVSLSGDVCNNYSSYSNYHDKVNTYDIAGDYDGTTKNVYVYVKDTYGEIVKESVPYKLYRNQAPIIEYATLSSKTDINPEVGNLSAIFSINAYDDFEDASDLKIQIVEDDVIKVDNANLSDYIGNENNYTLSGTYDGQNRNVIVKVIDKDGLVTTKEIEYSVYDNKSPEVETFNVYSKEIPCRDSTYCPLESNGNYNAYYQIKVSDDLDSSGYLQVCVSDSNSCDDYSPYSNYLDSSGESKEVSHTFSVSDINKPYDGEEKHLYLFVKDSYGAITTKDFVYKLYKNKGPTIINEPTLISNSENKSINILDATYSVAAEDDIDSSFEIKYCYVRENSSDEHCTDYEEYVESKVLDDTFFNVGRPNEQVFEVYAKMKDSYGKVTTTDPITYKLYKDTDPTISINEVVSGELIYENASGNVVTSLDGVDNPDDYAAKTKLKIGFSVDDSYDTYSVCVSENASTCNDYQGSFAGNVCDDTGYCVSGRSTYNVYYKKDGVINEGDTVSIYLFAKDSYGNITHKSVYSGEYELCRDYDEEDAVYNFVFNSVKTESEFGHTNSITIDNCSGKCYYYNPITGNENGILAFYTAKINYNDKFYSNTPCNGGNPINREYKAGCDFKDCFYKNNNYNRNAIGLSLVEDDAPWVTEINGDVYNCTGHYNLYLSSYTEGKSEITLTKTNTMICKEAFDDGVYDYDSYSNDPYVIIVD